MDDIDETTAAGIDSSRAARFHHLLEPIKDLAKSWNIDIASELQDYLTELESIVFSFDGGVTNLNFAEAALVIQGSACIYSRKVEFLYQLVVKTLEMLAMQGKVKATPSIDAEGKDKDFELIEDPKFLTLDDELVEATNIDLDEAAPTPARGAAVRAPTIRYQLRTPVALLRLADSDVNVADPLRRRRSELTKFKMNSSVLDDSGAVLLDQARPDSRTVFSPAAAAAAGPASPRAPLPAEPAVDYMDGGGWDNDGGGDGGGYGGADFYDNGDAGQSIHFPGVGGPMDLGTEAPVAEAPRVEFAASADPELAEENVLFMVHAQRERGGRAKTLAEQRAVAAAATGVDPWAPLDPHDPGTVAVAPFKRGKTWAAPRNVPTRPTLGATVAASRKAQQMSGPKAAVSAAIADLAAAEQVRRREWWKQVEAASGVAPALAAAGGAGFDDDLDGGVGVGLFGDPADNDITVDFGGGGGGGDGGGGGGYDGYDGGGGGYDDDGMGGDYGGAAEDTEVAPMVLAFDDDDDRQGPTSRLFHAGAGLDALVPQSYEELCRAHFSRYLADASKFIAETDLTRRVDEWQREMASSLAEEEARRSFDINVYGAELLDVLHGMAPPLSEEVPGEEVPFATVMAGKSVNELCRMFLAALQLANDGNIVIQSDGAAGAEEGAADFALSLVTTAPRIQLSSYMAPSVAGTAVEAMIVSAPEGGKVRGKGGKGSKTAAMPVAAACSPRPKKRKRVAGVEGVV